jgi:Ca-activated chloride channel family protein
MPQNNTTNPAQSPIPNMEVSLTPRKPAIRANGKGDMDVLLRVKAPATPGATVARTPLSLALVIDRSGSMKGDRLAAAKASAADLVNRLHGDDEVSIVIYDERVDLLLPLMPASQARDQIRRALSSFDAGGSTDLYQGWLMGAKQLAFRTGSNRLCRVILLSDGQANHGITEEDEICTQVCGLAHAGVSTTTVGLGEGFNESLMTSMAVAGQGNALYGERAEDLAEPFDSEIGLLSHLAWREVRLLAGSATSRWKLRNDYAAVGEHLWSMPSIAEGAEAWAVFTAPMDSAARAQTRSRQSKALHVTVTARDGEGRLHEVKASLPVLPEVDEAQWDALLEDKLVARRVAELGAADRQDEARDAVQRGDWSRAELLLRQVEELARDNEWLQGTVAQMKRLLERRDQARFSKEVMYASYSMKQRLAEVDEGAEFSESLESEKAAYLRRKAAQGRAF